MVYTQYDAILTKIKHVRKKYNKTQEDVASFLGITKQAYYRYEKGTRKMSIETIVKVAVFFNLPENYFLLNNVSTNIVGEEYITELLEYFQTLTVKLELKKAQLEFSTSDVEIKKITENIVFLHSEIINIKHKIIEYLDSKTNGFDWVK